MITILALRNPEPEYAGTRHNIGADVVRAFAERYGFSVFSHDKYLLAETSYGTIDGKEVQLLLSDTYMNESGRVVTAAKLTAEDLVVVHDELAFEVGTFKIAYNAGTGGHNGVSSVTNTLGTSAYTRLRVGIYPQPPRRIEGEAQANFVLKTFTSEERTLVDDAMSRMVEALEMIVTEGREKAMLKYHTSENDKISMSTM